MSALIVGVTSRDGTPSSLEGRSASPALTLQMGRNGSERPGAGSAQTGM